MDGSGPSLPLDNIHKIAVLRANAVGDYVYSIPALEALRVAYPQAEIVLIGKHWHKEFLAGRPGPIDRIEVAPYTPGVNQTDLLDPADTSAKEAADAFFRRMQAERFDLAIQMHGGGKNSNPFVRRLGARINAGLRTPDADELDVWSHFQYWQNDVFRWLECVALVGARPVSVVPCLTVLPRDRAEAESAYPNAGEALAVIHPGASAAHRRWSPAKFAAVNDALFRQGYQVALVGVSSEEKIASEVIEQAEHQPANLVGQLSVSGLLGLLERAAVLVGNDSGPVHLAEAIGTPSVGIYWAVNMINFGPVAVRNHRQLVSFQMDCPSCGLNLAGRHCGCDTSLVDQVSLADVLEQVTDVLRHADRLRNLNGIGWS